MKIKTSPLKSKVRDFTNTVLLLPSRLADVAKAGEKTAPHPSTFNANKVAAALHPGCMKLKITKIEELSPDFKRYTFAPESGEAAYFRAGQYLSFRIKIGAAVVTRAYSIASSPKAALCGEYQIAVKRVADGFVSGYILDNWKAEDEVDAYSPEGTFVYEPLRDAKTVVGAAGGSGITPFLSFAKAIADGTEDFNLTLLYGARNKKELFFKEELDEIAASTDKVKVVYVLSDSKAKGFEQGFISAELIKKYAPADSDFSIFACGPEAMYNFLHGEIGKLGLRRKFVRFEMQGVSKNAPAKAGIEAAEYKMTVINRGESAEYKCSSAETVLVALEKAGVTVPVRCRSGECGFCRSKLVSGEVFIPDGADFRRLADAALGYIHPCCCFPACDITIKLN